MHPQPIDYAYGTERALRRYSGCSIGRLRRSCPKTAAALSIFCVDPRGPFRLLAVGEIHRSAQRERLWSIQLWRYSHLLYILNHGTVIRISD